MVGDAQGNVYVVGAFVGKLFEGEHELEAGTTTASGFVAKLDACGEVVWSKRVGDDEDEQYALAAALLEGRLYVVGGHTGPFALDTHTVTHVSPAVGPPGTDIWLGAFDTSDGEVFWVSSYGGPNEDAPTGISAGGDRVVVTGAYQHEAVIGGAPLIVPDGNQSEGFLLAVDTSGARLGFASVTGVGGDVVTNVAQHDAGGVYALALFTEMSQPQSASAAGAYPDMALLRYDQDLEFQTMLPFVSGMNDVVGPLDIAIRDDRVAIAGLHTGSLTLGTETLQAEGTADGFVAVLDAATLGLYWARNAGGDGDTMDFGELIAWLLGAGELKADGLSDVIFSPDGDAIYAAGTCRGNFELEPGVFQACMDQEVVVMRLDASDGSTDWADVARGVGYDVAWGLTLAEDQLVVGGSYRGRLKFQNDPQLVDAGTEDNVFVARYGR